MTANSITFRTHSVRTAKILSLLCECEDLELVINDHERKIAFQGLEFSVDGKGKNVYEATEKR